MAHAKTKLPSKLCPVCKRPFVWRKKWAKVWALVRYCSERCQNEAKRERQKLKN